VDDGTSGANHVFIGPGKIAVASEQVLGRPARLLTEGESREVARMLDGAIAWDRFDGNTPPNLYVEPTMLDAARKAVELAK